MCMQYSVEAFEDHTQQNAGRQCFFFLLFNKRFILVFSYKHSLFFLSFFRLLPLKKKHFTAHFSPCLCCFVGQSAIRIDICGFRGNIKDNKKKVVSI